MPVYFSQAVMSTFQVSVTANSDDIDGSFRTSLRHSDRHWRPKKLERSSSGTRVASSTTKASSTSGNGGGSLGHQSMHRSSSYRDSAFDSLDSYRSSSVNSTPARSGSRLGQRRSRSLVPARSRSRTGNRSDSGARYDATIYDDAPLVSRYNQTGEMYAPVSYAWQAFKERLFDSSLSEKYETLSVAETPRSNRRYRSVSPGGYNDDGDDDPYSDEAIARNEHKKLLFLQDPLSRSMYKNLETFFDRKNIVRDSTGDFTPLASNNSGSFTSRSHTNFSRQNSQFFQAAADYSSDPPRPQSSLDYRPASSRMTARSLDPPRAHSSMDNRSSGGGGGGGSFFGRRKKEPQQTPMSARSHSAERPEDVRKEIQQRFAKINFDEGTTDYDALFTVSEEGGEMSGENNGEGEDRKPTGAEEHVDRLRQNGTDSTPKSKLDHLRY